MAKMNSLDDLFVHELRDMYNAEKQITAALPRMAKATEAPELKKAFETHLAETEKQIERLEKCFELLGIPARGKKCEGMAGIIEEGKSVLEMEGDANVIDAALIASAQKVEHYEIGSYGTAIAWAEALGLTEVAEVLNETLAEEKAADEKLSALAESGINEAATAGESEDDMEEDEDDEERSASSGTSQGAGASARSASGARAGNGAARSASSGSKGTRQRGGRR